MRLFVAIELPEEVRRLLSRLAEPLESHGVPRSAFARPENLHITLKFLGAVEDAKLPLLTRALQESVIGGFFELRPERIECLPERGPVRIVSVGFGGGVNPLRALQGSIESACSAIGFPPEGRRYRSHVTIARLKKFLPPAARRQLDGATVPPLPIHSFCVDHFTLVESHLGPGGSQYVPLVRFGLGGRSGDD